MNRNFEFNHRIKSMDFTDHLHNNLKKNTNMKKSDHSEFSESYPGTL